MRLRKFIETGPDSEPSRAAYLLGIGALPDPAEGKQWNLVDNFDAGDEILNDARMTSVFEAAIANGCAVVEIGLKAKK